jgi:hypothetical protein
MRQVEVRVLHPTSRIHAKADVLEGGWRIAESAVLLALLASFWGVILFVALVTAVR